MMELNVKEFELPAAIEFNFDELKAEVAEKMELYSSLVYTDDQIAEAKADRAKLRKLVDALNSKRKEIKAEILKPYTDFEMKLNEIMTLVNEPITLIDTQVKAYEDKKREAKRTEILTLWDSMTVPAGLDIGMIWSEKWLNATTSMKSIGESMLQAIEKFRSDMDTISGLPDYQFEAKEEYLATLDLGRAVQRAQYLREQAQRKAEYEYEAEQQRLSEQAKEVESHEAPKAEPKKEKTTRQWRSFSLYLSDAETKDLCKWIKDHNIRIRAI